jgi:excisionase family DNA binding protein
MCNIFVIQILGIMKDDDTNNTQIFFGIRLVDLDTRLDTIVEAAVRRVLAEKEPPKYYSMIEAAKRTGKSIHTLYTDHSRGRLSAFKSGRHLRFSEAQLVAYLEGKKFENS